jgi:hypothetical protein
MTDNTEPQLVEEHPQQPDLIGENAPAQLENSDYPLTPDQISLEAVINVLVQRGICSEAELFSEEKRLRAVQQTMAGLAFVPVHTEHPGHEHHKEHNALRHWASRHRWSRRIGTALFGWKWRKIKNNPA